MKTRLEREMAMIRKNDYAFTLIELLIVVAIIGILAAIAVPNFLNAMMKAKVSRASSELASLSKAYVMYRMDNNSYAPHIDGDPAQHKYVTTPVAYMSSSVLDIFADPSGPHGSQASWPWQCCTQGQYHSEPAYFAFDAQSNSPIRCNRQFAYFVISYGPDKMFDGETYDPSNGMISTGNMLIGVEGEYAVGYPYTTPQ